MSGRIVTIARDEKGEIMKKRFAKVMSLLMAMLVAVGMTGVAFAAEADKANLELHVDQTTIYVGQNWFELWVSDNADYGEDESALPLTYTVKSSNPKVVSVSGDEDYCTYAGKAAGKATLTVTYNYGGLTGTLSKVITVKNNPKALKALKINGKKVKLKKNKWSFNKKITKKATSVKVKATAAKGWTVKKAWGWAYTKNYKNEKQIKISKKAVKKGSKIKLAKKYKYCEVYVQLYNKSKKQYMTYVINYHR